MVTTRTQNYTYDAAARQPSGLESTIESLDGRRSRWLHLLSGKHYESVISEVLDQEMPKYEKSTVINASDRVTHKRECLHILASASSVLAAAVEGNLVRRMQTESTLQQEYVTIFKSALDQPSIYIHLLADCDGNAPTPSQYLKIRDFVIDYLSQGKVSEHAWQIDKISPPLVTQHDPAEGHRKYLHTTSRSEKRVKILELFCQGVGKRYDETPVSLREIPLRYPLSECGYSINSHERLAQHRARKSSNNVMNLVEDICTHLHHIGIFAQHFTMHQFIVYLIFRQEQARIAEIFISGLLQVWVKDGGGFNAYKAGHSANTAGRVTDVEWTSHERNTKLYSPMMENIRHQQLRADERRQALEPTDANPEGGKMGVGSADEAECMSIQQPQSYAAALLKKRRALPSYLHIFVARQNVHDIRSLKQFNYDALSQSSIEAHFQHVTSSFISLYESEDTASRKRPHTVKVRDDSHSYDAVIVDIDTSGMTPAWMSMGNDVHIPVWFEKDIRESEDAHHEEVLWICLGEVKEVLLLDTQLRERGEWLACGFIPQSRVIMQSRSSSSEPPQRVFNDEEKYKADRQARREQNLVGEESRQIGHQELEHMIKKAQSSRSLKTPPSIPTRKSSLCSLARKAISESKNQAGEGSKISYRTRNARITVTNADPRSATSLMKYAILMAHGKRLEGEETWLSETTSSAGSSSRAGSVRTIENGSRAGRRNDFAAHGIRTPMTPPASPKEPSRGLDTHERRHHGNVDDPTLRYELAQHNDKPSPEKPRSLRRSAAPSPSQSMVGFHLERGNGSSLRPRRSRRDLLLELQSDQDSILREYARVSLEDPNILQQVRSQSHRGSTTEDEGSRIHNHEENQSFIFLRDRLAASTPSLLVPDHGIPPSHGTHDETQEVLHVIQQAPSLYSTMTSLGSLSTFAPASIGEAVYVSVGSASHVTEVEIVRSKNGSGSGSGSDRSGRQSSVPSNSSPRLQELPGGAEAEAVIEPFPALNPWVQAEQPEREAPSPPRPEYISVPAALFPPSTPALTPSKGEAFLARAKCLGEKGRNITSRIAEIKERQSKSEAKRDKWGLGIWRSSEKKGKNGNRRTGEQDE
ncbi:hypothetical protein G6011_00229 [Alternaria panax]|uniref:Uncharacterized protein n=1 Tax=Alternaria panax TaxID=48097 RepID=A0AAD4IIT5_9PLEO|nr:hypothetical protein G6011_00229 [Alternaria panax]